MLYYRTHLDATNPNFRFKEVSGSHHVHLNDPLTVIQEIRSFIQEFNHVFEPTYVPHLFFASKL